MHYTNYISWPLISFSPLLSSFPLSLQKKKECKVENSNQPVMYVPSTFKVFAAALDSLEVRHDLRSQKLLRNPPQEMLSHSLFPLKQKSNCAQLKILYYFQLFCIHPWIDNPPFLILVNLREIREFFCT